jgi:transposase
VLANVKAPSAWQQAIKQRRPTNVAVVAQAAKTARIIWAVSAKEQAYEGHHKSIRPAMA